MADVVICKGTRLRVYDEYDNKWHWATVIEYDVAMNKYYILCDDRIDFWDTADNLHDQELYKIK